jgi:hypothetical protein
MQPSLTTLLEQLRTAFPAKPIQSKGAFHDWGATYLDAEHYAKQLEGKTWQEVDRAYLITRSDALGFLGTRHLVAVLPVYLRSLIEDGVWSHAADPLLLLLTKPGPDKKTGLKLPRFEALVDALNPMQCAAIAVVLRAFAATDETGSLGKRAQAALERHWKAYLPDDV